MMRSTRRDFGKLALAGVPASLLAANIRLAAPENSNAKINARINGVTIGAITYSFRAIPAPMDIIRAYTTIGLGEMELMSNHAEALAGAPSAGAGGGGRGRGTPPTPEEIAAREAAAKALAEGRASATEATVQPVRAKIADAGIDLRLLC